MDIIHLLLLLSGLCSLSSCVLLYEFFQDQKTWDEAQSFCREKHGDLATMYNLEQMQTALEAVGEHFGEGVWIGLYKDTNLSWHWSLNLEGFYKDGERDYLNWGVQIGNYNCGAFKNGLLYARACTSNYRAVCFDVTKTKWQQYRPIDEPLTWEVAQEYCRTHHTDLVSVRNEEESQILESLVQGIHVWIGLFRDPWKWAGGHSSSFRYWTADTDVRTNDKEQCVTVREDRRWEQHDCTQHHPFLCVRETTYTHIYKVTISLKGSGLDLDEPEVKEDILKLIKKQLNGINVEGVRWTTQPDGRVFMKEPKKQEDPACEI